MEENRHDEVRPDTPETEPEEEPVTDETIAEEPQEAADPETRDDAEDTPAEQSAQDADDAQDAQETDQTPEDGQDPEDAPRRGLFGRKKKDKRDQQIEELTDRVQRQMAEFDNFRKRSEKEKSAMYEIGAKSVIEKILPVIDNFERGFAGLTGEQKADPFAQGMEKVYRQMLTMLEGLGVKPIEAVGKPFDPNFHNAVMHVEDEEAGDNVVVEEFQKGYLYRDSVVRHSMVKVAN